MENNKKALVIGASENPSRYSYKAIHSLRAHHYEVEAIGKQNGKVGDVSFSNERPPFENIHTITLYINPQHQKAYYDYMLSLKPRRIIFNPGTENPELETLARQQGIEALSACTLVLLSTGQF